MELVVDRKWKKDSYTIGVFLIDGIRFSNTMEDADRGLMQYMSAAEIKRKKIYGETAIPRGKYRVRMTYSPKFALKAWAKPTKGMVPQIMDVPGYDGIRIHPLNCAKDSLGCIGLGVNDRKGWISQSTKYYTDFVAGYLQPALERGEDVWIIVK